MTMAKLIWIFQSSCTNHMFDVLEEVGGELKLLFLFLFGPIKIFTVTYIRTIGRLCVV